MTELVWHELGDRFFETGLDRGVLYLEDGSGVAWNGLVSISENGNTTVDPIYLDGRKINDKVTVGDYSATLSAYTYPVEFERFDGVIEVSNGFSLAHQGLSRFGLSYRTRIGNELFPILGYKIHVLYNLLATISDVSFLSTSDSVSAIAFEWKISAIPVDIPDYEPTAHFVLDTTRAPSGLVTAVEDQLYGSSSANAKLPPLSYFLNLATMDW
jgi:hypothetical protein